MRKEVCIIIICLLLPAMAYAAEGLKIGSKAPNFLGRTQNGKIFRLYKLGERPKVINFWWVYCIPCKKEMPELVALDKQHSEVTFAFVHTVATDEDKIPLFLEEIDENPSLIVKGNKSLLNLYKFKGLPHTVVLDSSNNILLVISGYTEQSMKKLQNMLQNL